MAVVFTLLAAIFTAVTLPIAWLAFRYFIGHNVKRNIIQDLKNEDVMEAANVENGEMVENEKIAQETNKSPFDVYFWATVIVYVAFMISTARTF